jgi:hypothetical protein
MRIRRTLSMVVPLLLLLITAAPANGQVDYSTATLKGSVVDRQGGVVPGAMVTITNPATGLTKNQQTTSEGTYLFPLLPIGTYKLEVTHSGFEKAVASDIVLTVGQAVVLDITLTVGTANTVVEVTTAAPLIAVEQVQQANQINQDQIEQLPNVDRQYGTYVQTLPGITDAQAIHNAGSQRFIAAFPVNPFTTSGGNGRGGLVTIDGGENDYGSGIGRTYHLPVDSIQEFQVNRNGYNAEYGFSSSEYVSIVTKTGTNNYHGMVFGTFRNEGTDAHQYFQPLSPNGYKLFDQDWHAGGNFGGPLIKDKLFFFGDYEGYQTAFKTYNSFTGSSLVGPLAVSPGQTAYIAAIQAGAFCGPEPCATLASNLATALIPQNSAVVNGLLGTPGNLFGIPNQTGAFTNRDTWNDAVLRLDWQPDSTNSFTIRGLLEFHTNPASYGGLSEYMQVANTAPSSVTGFLERDYEIVASWAHIFSPAVVNALRVQFVPEYVANTPNVASTGGTVLAFDVMSPYDFGAPALGPVPNYTSYQKRLQFEDSVSWTYKTHSIKFGLSYRPAYYNISDGLYAHSQVAYLPGIDFPGALVGPSAIIGQPNGKFTPPITAADFAALITFNIVNGFVPGPPAPIAVSAGCTLFFTPTCSVVPLASNLFAATALNAMQAFSAAIPVQFRTSFGNPKWTSWGNYGGVYAQDTWKITPRLTISPGLRFDVNAEPFPTGGTQTICNPNPPVSAATVSLTSCTGAPGAPVGTLRTFQTNPTSAATLYVSPRLGLAYQLTADGKTVLRASGGAYVGASELQAVYYSNLYNPNGLHLNQAEVTLGSDAAFLGLLSASSQAGRLPVFPPTAADFEAAGLTVGPNQPHAVIITQGDTPCGGGQNPFGCGTYRSSYSTQASMSIQRQLTTNTSFEVGYNFQRTFHLQDPRETNFVQAVSGPTDPAGAGIPLVDKFLGPMLVPINPNVETGTLYCSCGDAWYNGLTVSLTRRFANNLQFQVNYTYQKATDDVLDFSSFNSSYYPTLFPKGVTIDGKQYGRDRGLSAYNITNVFVANAVYTTSFQNKFLANWTIAPILSINSGIPFQVLIDPGQGLAGECLTVAACEAGTATSNGLVQEALNQARPFAAPRNSGIGPWVYEWDMSFRKGLYLNSEKGVKLDFIFNFSNILNITNFLGVNGVFPGVTNGVTASQYGLPNGGNLLNGPFTLYGNKAINQAELAHGLLPNGTPAGLLGSDPLSFVSAGVPRQVQFGLQLSF